MGLYQDLCSDFRKLIENRTLAFGERLPSVRTLSRARGVSITTVLEAYRHLEAEGLIEGRARSGYFVSFQGGNEAYRLELPKWIYPVRSKLSDTMPRIITELSNPALLHLSAANPDPEVLPIAALNKATREIVRTMARSVTSYGDPQGVFPLRRRIVDLMLERGVVTTPDEVVVTNGCQEALFLAFHCICKPGDVVAVESPTYPGALHALEAVGAKVVEVPGDARTGMDLDDLERALGENEISLVVVTPRCSNPTGASFTAEGVKRLYDIACRHDLTIVEDDTNWGLSFAQPELPPLKSVDRENRVIYCSSLSKSVAPALRVGWLLGGPVSGSIIESKYVMNMGGPVLPQMIASKYLGDRRFSKDLDRARRIHVDTVGCLARAVQANFPEGVRVSAPTGGFVMWLELPHACDGTRLRDDALEYGISVAPGRVFSSRGGFENYIRLGWGGVWNERVERAVSRLGELCRMQ